MKSKSIDGLSIHYASGEESVAELITQASTKSVELIQDLWGLDTPVDCRVFVMTSWQGFLRQSAPWHWRILLILTMPLWYRRINRMWKFAGGWAQSFGKRKAVGIKTPELLEVSDRSMGEMIFIQEDSIKQKVEQITCHELVHTFSSHLKLPVWLHEGIAMLTVDKYHGTPTVKPETLESLEVHSHQNSISNHRRPSIKDKEAMIYQYVHGYWITRYLHEVQRDELKAALKTRRSHDILETRIASGLGMARDEFWTNIDDLVLLHFKGETNKNNG
jgi:hypothetical protein